MPLSLRLGLGWNLETENPRERALCSACWRYIPFSVLAFSIPDIAPDEHFPAVHPNDWSSNEQHQEKRRKEPPFSSFPPQNTSMPAQNLGRWGPFLTRRAARRRSQPLRAKIADFTCKSLLLTTSLQWTSFNSLLREMADSWKNAQTVSPSEQRMISELIV